MTAANDPRIRLLGISGSIRRDSYSTIVLSTLKDALSATAEMTLFPLNDIPLYNADLDGEAPPEAVAALKAAVKASDGLVICSPEYNYGMTGVLKNALDWASRPAFNSPLKDKPALIMTASPAYTGGARAQHQILETLCATLSRVVARPQVVIAGVNQKIVDGRLTDEATLKFAGEAVDDLLQEIRVTRPLAAQAA